MMFIPPFYRYPYGYTFRKYIPHNNYLGTKTDTPISIEKTTKKESRNLNDSPFFEIFGLSLYFDDVLLICLIFFLYQEGVQDEFLFMALIFLLLS